MSFARFHDDPTAFFREVLGVEPWSKQREILDAVARSSRVAVRSGHKTGKSNSAAGIALWWVSTRPRGRVILTSATDRQVRSILWKELRARYKNARQPLGGDIHLDPATGLQFSDGREVIGFTARDPERMAGFSGDEMLIIADEASGIDDAIFEAIEGNRAGGAQLLLTGNPTKTSGEFFDAFHSKREHYVTLRVSSEETPNVVEGRRVVPGLATREWVAEKAAEWGKDSPLYAVRVRGDFPAQADNAVIGLALVEAATKGWAAQKPEGRLQLGVDVARFGDDETVIAPRRGLKAMRMTALHSMDVVEVAGHALRIARELRDPLDRELPRIAVDEIGVGGGVVDILRRHRNEVEVVAVNVARNADARDDFHRIRDQLWFGVADWIRDGGTFEADSKLEGELVAPTYRFDTQGRRVVESKDEIKKRLSRSPDRADALCLAVYGGGAVEVKSFRVKGL